VITAQIGNVMKLTKKKKEGTSKANGQKGIISMPVNSISN
jgi:hypothetical protein